MAPNWTAEIATLASREAQARLAGGEARLAAQRGAGKLTARERIDALVDPGSFVELGMFAEHQCHDFGMAAKKFPGDGVITGHGTIAGRSVYVYAEDATVLGGSSGRVHGTKIHRVLRQAREHLVPVIGLHDSGGARIQEGMDNVYGMTGVFRENVLSSGAVPQLVGIMGTCAGGAAYSAALADFIVQVEGTSLFVTGPAMVQEVHGETVSAEALGGAEVHATRSGVTHLVARDDRHCLALIGQLLAYLPQSHREPPPRHAAADSAEREVPELQDIVPADPGAGYDMRAVVRAIADGREFLELQAGFARNLVTGFLRLDGRAVGIVANNPAVMDGMLDLDAADKAARFVRTCDAFNIPLATLVDSPGFLPGVPQEHAGLIRHGAKMLHAWVEASVPKVSCVLRKMYGGAIPAMGVHEIGFDQVLAWPGAEMQMVPAVPAVKILCRRELDAARDPQALLERKVAEYRELYLTPYHSASLLVVDAVIRPQDTRKRLIAALGLLENKPHARRKRSNPPL
ncbi:MAG TPA: acyl-CoA carboxylase subunit beta [Burkholderiales bacterium]|nr:acyl-CoA carboxylase subunit beta [Burkholderiales bacterium]